MAAAGGHINIYSWIGYCKTDTHAVYKLSHTSLCWMTATSMITNHVHSTKEGDVFMCDSVHRGKRAEIRPLQVHRGKGEGAGLTRLA